MFGKIIQQSNKGKKTLTESSIINVNPNAAQVFLANFWNWLIVVSLNIQLTLMPFKFIQP